MSFPEGLETVKNQSAEKRYIFCLFHSLPFCPSSAPLPLPRKLGNLETGKLGNWETQKLGNLETRQRTCFHPFLTVFCCFHPFSAIFNRIQRYSIIFSPIPSWLCQVQFLPGQWFMRHCKHLQRSQSDSVELIFAPWLKKNSGSTLVPNRR